MKKVKKTLLFAIRYAYHLLFSGFFSLGWKVGFENQVRIDGAKYISLGNRVSLASYSFLGIVEQNKNKKSGSRLTIEDNVGIGYGTIIFAIKSIQIKKNAILSPFCFICDYNHSYTNPQRPVIKQPIGKIRPVIIKEGSWLGTRVTVCPGVTIGKNSVIGAGSVVTKDIPDYSVAVGVPAKVVKKYNAEKKRWERISKNKRKR